MCLFILGLDVTDDTAICYIGALGDFIPVDRKQSVIYLDVPYSFEKVSTIFGHDLALFQFIGDLHEVPVFLRLDFFGANECINHYLL